MRFLVSHPPIGLPNWGKHSKGTSFNGNMTTKYKFGSLDRLLQQSNDCNILMQILEQLG